MKANLTDISVRSLKPPSRGQEMHWDKSVPGFGVRISPAGTKTYVLVHGKKRRRVSIGRVGEVSLANARRRAWELIATSKADLIVQPSIVDLSDTVGAFLTAYREKNKQSTADETERLLKRHLTLGKALGDIGTTDLTKLIDNITAPSTKQHVFVAARTFFNWCVKRRLLDASPMAGLDLPYRAKSRERVLSKEELTAVLHSAEGSYGDLLRMLVLTGQRVGQFTSLEARFIDRELKRITWPGSHMKANDPHTIPYGNIAAAIIDRRYRDGLLFPNERGDKPFSNFSTAHAAFTRRCPLPHWTRHDLRRSVATHWAAPPMRVSPHIIEALLAHRGGVVSGVTAIYLRYGYLEEIAVAMTRWEQYLEHPSGSGQLQLL